MARISAALSGLERTLLNRLAEARAGSELSTLRLTSGQRINSPADDPSGFIALSNFRTQQSVVRATLGNAQAATGIASQVQLTVDRIRTQANLIRSLAAEDEDQSLSTEQRSEKQLAIDAAVTEINRLAGTSFAGRQLLSGNAGPSTAGRNANQVRDLQVWAVGGGGPLVSAKRAELYYAGVGGHVAADASITLRGAAGSTTIALTTDQSLAEAARNINDRTSTTGVAAELRNGSLVLASVDVGARQIVELEVVSGAFTVTGGDGAGHAQGRDAAYGSQPAISGWVSQAATQAELTYTGTAGNISADATVTLRGNRGDVSLAFDNVDSLATAAARINGQSHRTGIVATAAGNSLTLRSVDYGARASLSVQATAGTFTVSGGDGAGNAKGSDASAVIGGVEYRGYQDAQPAEARYTGELGKITADAEFTLTGSLGSHTFIVASGNNLTAVRDAINLQAGATGIAATVDFNDLVLRSTTAGAASELDIEVVDGSFDTETTPGADAQANPRVDGNRFTVDQGGSRFTIEFAAGFVGDFSPITLADDGVQFALSTDPGERTPLPIPSVLAARLGGLSGMLADLATGGAASGLGANASRALRIADEALGVLDRVDGIVDGFAMSAAASSVSLMQAFDEDLTDSINVLDQVDDDEEELLRGKYDALVHNAQAGLAVLQRQRQDMLSMLRRIAGVE